MSYQHPRISVEQACQAYSLSFSELNYDNGLLSGWVSREDLTYPLVHFINPATKTKVGPVDRWTFRLLIVEQILEINQSQGAINSTHDTMDFVSDAIQQELNRNEMAEVTNWVAREVQQFADANVTGWLVDVTFEGAGQCIGLDVSKVATPVFNPSRGIFGGFGEFTLTCATPDSDIYYTLDGSPVTPQTATLYTGDPVVFNQTTQPKAKAFKTGLIDSDTAVAQFQVDLLTLSFNVAGGVFPIDSPPTIVPIINNIDADVYYTTDGSTPTELSTPFTSPFTPTQNTTLTGRGFLDPALPSNVVAQTYQLKLNAPVLDTVSGTYTSQKLVSATPAAVGVNEYRIDGGSWVVGDSVLVDVSSVVDFRATDPNYVTSDEVSVTITIQCAAPTISPAGLVFEGSQEVTITTNEAGGTTYYTTDGTTPTESSTLYTAPFTLTESAPVRSRTFRSGCEPSNVVFETYTKKTTIWIVPALNRTTAPIRAASLWLSLDLGASWSNVVPSGLVSLGVTANKTDNSLVSIISGQGLRKSVNLGVSWSDPITGPEGQTAMSLIHQDGDLGVAISDNIQSPSTPNIYITTNGFSTIQSLVVAGLTTAQQWGGVYVRGNNILVVTQPSAAIARAYLSTDSGASFTQVYASLTNFRFSSPWISLDGQTMIFCARTNVDVDPRIVKSINGGLSWTEDTARRYWEFNASDDAEIQIGLEYFGTTQRQKSFDGGLTWANLTGALTGTQPRIYTDSIGRTLLGTAANASLRYIAEGTAEVTTITNIDGGTQLPFLKPFMIS